MRPSRFAFSHLEMFAVLVALMEPYNRIQLSGLPYFLEAIGRLGSEFGATVRLECKDPAE